MGKMVRLRSFVMTMGLAGFAVGPGAACGGTVDDETGAAETGGSSTGGSIDRSTGGGFGRGGASGDTPTTDPGTTEPVRTDWTSGCDTFDSEGLIAATGDADCDVETPTSCPEGSHIDFSAESPCAVCIDDTDENRSCEWAATCFEPFILHIAHASGAKRCQVDSDCSTATVSAGCGAEIALSLNGLLNEEIPMIAELYASQNCSLCAESSGYSVSFGSSGTCDQGVCAP